MYVPCETNLSLGNSLCKQFINRNYCKYLDLKGCLKAVQKHVLNFRRILTPCVTYICPTSHVIIRCLDPPPVDHMLFAQSFMTLDK